VLLFSALILAETGDFKNSRNLIILKKMPAIENGRIKRIGLNLHGVTTTVPCIDG
jgi:hypothetical protein